jgi:hypothetical protein
VGSLTLSLILAGLSAAASAAEPGSPLDALAAAVNARGAELTAEDLAPLFDPAYLKDGFGPREGAAECATVLRGVRVSAVELSGVPVPGGGEAALAGRLRLETSSGPVVRLLEDDRHTLCSLARVRDAGDGRWRFVGNGLPARALAHASLARRQWGAPCPDCAAPRARLRLLVSAPPGALSTATARWAGGEALLARSDARVLEVALAPGPGRALDVWTEHWAWEPGTGEALPPAGTEVVFTLDTAAGARVAVTRRLPAWPKAAARITAPSGHRLKDARLGGDLAVSWTVPDGFEPVAAELVGILRADGALCEADTRPALLAPSVRSAVLPWPATCAGHVVAPAKKREGDPPAALTLQLSDAEGRTLEVFHAFW